ncbi:WhiB family transcriptional regulator [Lentzea sp. NEAU-D13]|uniref:Transcriptional regulator WhiB n=12 Tax=Lentzea TaxID=165301 RepID=A0A7C9RMY0_9PSEU|nr:WhiB family transcriptional regulator [Lentzea alba]NKE63053.1 WhiB family transcriptional regulator [Lentzea indica]
MSFVVVGTASGVRQPGRAEGEEADEMQEFEELEEDHVTQPVVQGELSYLFDPADEQDWQERALCAQTDPEAFFPEKGGSTREAKRICLGCEVRSECLEYALQHDERFGIWGGLSERERRKLKKRAV